MVTGMEKEGTGKKVLVVDDKEDSRRLVKKVLGLRGYSVVEADNGEDAISVTQKEHPDLILMDIRLRTGMNGIEVTRHLKEIPEVAAIPIVAMTASVSPEDMQRALDTGCSSFIRKPIDIDELPRLVAEYIGRSSSPQ
jgi:CheY-like chemotaxis protein